MSQPVQAPVRLTYQEVLRSIGSWIDVRGYQEIHIAGGVDGITIEGVLSPDEAGTEPERLVLDSSQLLKFCEASRLNRSPLPTVNPPTRRHLTIVSLDPPEGDSTN